MDGQGVQPVEMRAKVLNRWLPSILSCRCSEGQSFPLREPTHQATTPVGSPPCLKAPGAGFATRRCPYSPVPSPPCMQWELPVLPRLSLEHLAEATEVTAYCRGPWDGPDRAGQVAAGEGSKGQKREEDAGLETGEGSVTAWWLLCREPGMSGYMSPINGDLCPLIFFGLRNMSNE